MSAVLKAQEPGAKCLADSQPPLLQNFDLLATAPGGVAKLRELILTLAVRGKLVQQDPSDEPASELLKRTRINKELIARNGKAESVDPALAFADEWPFAIPATWEWVRLSDLQPEFQNGASSRGDTGGIPTIVVRLADIRERRISLDDHRRVPIRPADIEKYRLFPGDILITRVNGSADIVGQFNLCDGPLPEVIYCDHFIRTRISQELLNPRYCAMLGESSLVRRRIRGLFVTTAGQKTVNQGHIGSLAVPLPPLAEQLRVVARVNELMDLCNALEGNTQFEAEQHAQLLSVLLDTLTDSATPEELATNWQRVAAHFDLLLDRPEAVDALEQTILQLAVRGRLVPQDPNDPPASVLLKQIRAEKERVIHQGKTKRGKSFEPISDEKEPFQLPQGWEWARFPDLGEFGRGKSKHRPRNDPVLFNPPIYPLVQTGEVARAKGIVREFHSKYSEFGLAQSRIWPSGTLCITIAANIADAAMLGFDACFPDSVVGFVPAPAIGRTDYFLAFMETARTELIAYAPATAQMNINLEILGSLRIPVPPLAEIERIVVRLNHLRCICAELRERLTACQSTQCGLAEHLIEQAVG